MLVKMAPHVFTRRNQKNERGFELFACFSRGEDSFKIELCHMNLTSKHPGEGKRETGEEKKSEKKGKSQFLATR